MWINGKAADSISALDRGLLYGDGAFETLLMRGLEPVLLEPHLQRLQKTCLRLQIEFSLPSLRRELDAFLMSSARHDPVLTDSMTVLKIIVTRGEGGRGYRPPAIQSPVHILQLHALPADLEKHASEGVKVQLCHHPVSRNRRLAGLKHLNRLDQVLASQELAEGVTEGLMFDEQELLIEGTRSNVFIVLDGVVCTPDLHLAGVEGIVRASLLDAFAREGVRHEVREIGRGELPRVSELFVCNSIIGIQPVTSIIGVPELAQLPAGPHTRHAQQLLQAIMAS